MGSVSDSAANMATHSVDTLIIGAGISGINTAYRLQSRYPSADYTILETRENLGGTWDLFRYPGIRSDSDLWTFGFEFEPWPHENPIAEADLILSYMKMVVSKHGIDKHIRFQHKVLSADWSSNEQCWTMVVDQQGQHKKFIARFLVLGTGYYNYYEPLNSVIPGIDSFKGKVIHAQFWPKDYDYKDKKVIVIGSGATATTIFPNMVKRGAGHVTMLQRSPSYIFTQRNSDRAPFWVRKYLPLWVTSKMERMFHRVITQLVILYCHSFPQRARQWIIGLARSQLPKRLNWSPHFDPKYTPWQQRMCMAPDGDIYKVLHTPEKAEIVTGVIDTVTETGIALKEGSAAIDDTSPSHLDADVIVAATGLNMNFGGLIDLRVDGEKVDWSRKFVWNGCMIEGVPNMFFMFGYTNASWTLGADDSATIMVRVRKHMDKQAAQTACPRLSKGADTSETYKMWQLSSTYVKATGDKFPKYLKDAPWRPKTSPTKDYWHANYGNIDKGLHFVG